MSSRSSTLALPLYFSVSDYNTSLSSPRVILPPAWTHAWSQWSQTQQMQSKAPVRRDHMPLIELYEGAECVTIGGGGRQSPVGAVQRRESRSDCCALPHRRWPLADRSSQDRLSLYISRKQQGSKREKKSFSLSVPLCLVL